MEQRPSCRFAGAFHVLPFVGFPFKDSVVKEIILATKQAMIIPKTEHNSPACGVAEECKQGCDTVTHITHWHMTHGLTAIQTLLQMAGKAKRNLSQELWFGIWLFV